VKSIILVTGAGTGIGKLSAQALAEAVHIVNATMRDVTGRNRGRLSALTPSHADPQAVADEVARIVGLAKGLRPMRSVIDFVGDGAAEVLEVSERVRIEFAHRIGISELLQANVRT